MEQVYSVGMDQYKRSSTLHIRGPQGESVRQLTVRHVEGGSPPRLRETLESLEQPVHVAVEATGFYRWMVQDLRSLGAHVHLARPSALRLIFRAKNKPDDNDAERRSRLVWLGQAPESYIPTEGEAQRRELVGTRQLLVGMRVALANRIDPASARPISPSA